MKKLILKILLFFTTIMIAMISLGLFKKNEEVSSDYMEAIIDKHIILDHIQPPRIIFGGGSNLAFGLDSKKIEEETGMHVVNMGLHAGLGLTFILNELKSSIKENDIVFLSIEYFLKNRENYSLMKYASDYFPPAKKYYSESYFGEFKAYLEYEHKLYKSIFAGERKISIPNQKVYEIYSRESFNEYGDVTAHLYQTHSGELGDKVDFTYRYWEGIKAINLFSDYAKNKKVEVFFLFPTFPNSQYEKNKKVISQLEIDLRKNLKIKILNSPSDFVYPDSLFFDTVYHLNKTGRSKRTEGMVELIKKVI